MSEQEPVLRRYRELLLGGSGLLRRRKLRRVSRTTSHDPKPTIFLSRLRDLYGLRHMSPTVGERLLNTTLGIQVYHLRMEVG